MRINFLQYSKIQTRKETFKILEAHSAEQVARLLARPCCGWCCYL